MNNDTPRQSQRHIEADFATSDKRSHERRENDEENRRSIIRKYIAATAIATAFFVPGVFITNEIVGQEIKRQDKVSRQYAPLSHSIEQNKNRVNPNKPQSNSR